MKYYIYTIAIFWGIFCQGQYSVEKQVDSIMTMAIRTKAFPGAQLLVAKSGKVIFHKSYGYQTYDSITLVHNKNLYDLASVTKITATLPAIMRLVDQGKINLDAPMSTYWKPWKHHRDKKTITVREVLSHQAGLKPYIIFINDLLKGKNQLKKRFVSTTPHKQFSIKAYDSLYIHKRFIKKIYRKINRSKVSPEKTYLYSGLSFLIFPKIIENLTGENFESYLNNNFYKPIGANQLTFNPKEKNYPLNEIIPTEHDTIYRHTYLKGWVHDENASLFGGVSGNAGLFGTADDLGKIMQMYLNMGYYGGKRYLSEKTMKTFTSIQYPDNNNRRGLGFDKPLLNNPSLDITKSYPAPEVGMDSFGHSGYTGSFVWVDPKHQMVFVFLSNRVYPSRSHNALYKLNIRPLLMQIFLRNIDANSIILK